MSSSVKLWMNLNTNDMRVLLVTDEVWNDRVFGNNVLQNWFEGMPDVEIAQICAIPGKPLNKVCSRYFQLTDMAMFKSILGHRAGTAFNMTIEEMQTNPQTTSYVASSSFYSFMKKISGTPVRLLREFVWNIGRFNREALKDFISDFNPDIVFCPRLSTWKTMRIEKTVARCTDAPFVAFTGDDEASYREYSWSPLYWVNRFFFHHAFKKHIGIFKHYFTCSEDQAREYQSEYGISTSTLYKRGDMPQVYREKPIGSPIRMVYAGRLYCNRWKSLAEIGKALKAINADGIKMVLDIYTQEKLTIKQAKELSPDSFIFVKGAVSPAQLKHVYNEADVALHVESFDRANRLRTRTSFSTKIIDLMASTCAIIALCWKEQAGFKYLQSQDAAFCIDSYEKILPQLQQIVDHPHLITQYAEKAYRCGVENHNRGKIQGQIISKFQEVISQS